MVDLDKTGHVISSSDKKPGFFYGYIVLLAGFIIMGISWGALFSFGVFFKPMLGEFGWSREITSGAYALNLFLQGPTGLLAGRLSDRFGSRAVVTAFGLLSGLGYLLMSTVNNIWQIYLFYGVLVSISGVCVVPVLSSVAKWFARRRGLMTGIVASGAGVGTIIMPPLANRLILSYDWRTSYIVVGLIVLVVMVVMAQFLRRKPAQVGQPVDRNGATGAGLPDLRIQGLSVAEAVRTRQLWLMCILFFISGYSIQTAVVHIVPHATDIGISAANAASILSVFGAVSIASRLVLGSGGDRRGNKPVLAIAAVSSLFAFFWLLFASELWMFYLFAVALALALGGPSALQSPAVAEFFGLKAHGAIFGITSFAVSVGGAAGTLIAGRIFDTTGRYFLAFLICGILGVVGLVLALMLKSKNQAGLKNY